MSIVTQDKFEDTKQYFMDLFTEEAQSFNGAKSLPLFAIRKEAVEKVQGMKFPTRRDEDWKYTALTRVFAPSYKEGKMTPVNREEVARFALPEANPFLLVFVNGQFQPELSDLSDLPDGVIIKSISEALLDESLKDKLEKQLKSWQTDAGKTLVTLNTAFARNGFIISVEKNVEVVRPFHFLYLQRSNVEQSYMAAPQHIVHAKQGAQVTLIESYRDQDYNERIPYFINSTNRITVEKNAHVAWYKIQDLHKGSFQVTNTEVEQDRDSTFSSYVIDLGGRIVRNNLSVFLKDQNINTNMYGLYLGKKDQHIDNQTFIDHAFPHCESNEFYKGILTDKAVGVFNGKVMVRQDAQKTNAFQQNSSLVLSETAKMDSKPQLEIFADDVKCSHGATIGQLDEDSIYYLRSRGLSTEDAKSLLQFAFMVEVLEAFKLDAVKDEAEAMIRQRLV